jgi:mannose-6-phosphate isomerase-like protein (cupin superfamily)
MTKIEHEGKVLAIIICSDFDKEGIEFFTPGNFSQQLGYMNRPKGYVIPPHRHNIVPREVIHTQEVLFIKSGKVRVDFYDDDQSYLESRILLQGDVILLAAGGHGFEMIEPSEIIEVKQGPYIGEQDKVRFDHVEPHKVKLYKDEK